MKATEEIYSIRFNKCLLPDDLHFSVYTLGMPIGTALGLIIPESIILKGEKITITFNNKTKHIIHYSSDVELFIREKEKPKTEK